jgi:transposase
MTEMLNNKEDKAVIDYSDDFEPPRYCHNCGSEDLDADGGGCRQLRCRNCGETQIRDLLSKGR